MLKIFCLIIFFSFIACGKQASQNKYPPVKPTYTCVKSYELNEYNDYDPDYDLKDIEFHNEFNSEIPCDYNYNHYENTYDD